MNASTVLAILTIVIAVPLNWYATLILWRLSRQAPDARVLFERAIAALSLSLIVTIFALIFVNNEIYPPPFDTEATRVITRTAILALTTLPALYWLRRYRKS